MSQDLHLKASGFLAEGSSFLTNMCSYPDCYCERNSLAPRDYAAALFLLLYGAKKGREIVRQTPKSTKVKKTEKRRPNYVPMSYCLLFSITLLR